MNVPELSPGRDNSGGRAGRATPAGGTTFRRGECHEMPALKVQSRSLYQRSENKLRKSPLGLTEGKLACSAGVIS